MSIPTPSGTPKPDPGYTHFASAAATEGNPKTVALGTPSEEAVKFFRLITAARSVVRLLTMQSGRVLATCTSPPSPPATGEPNHQERTRWTADELAGELPAIIAHSTSFDQFLQDVESGTMGARTAASEGNLK